MGRGPRLGQQDQNCTFMDMNEFDETNLYASGPRSINSNQAPKPSQSGYIVHETLSAALQKRHCCRASPHLYQKWVKSRATQCAEVSLR